MLITQLLQVNQHQTQLHLLLVNNDKRVKKVLFSTMFWLILSVTFLLLNINALFIGVSVGWIVYLVKILK